MKFEEVLECKIVEGFDFFGYNPEQEFFIQIYFSRPWMRNKIADLLRDNVVFNRPYTPYEAHIQYDMQFMADYCLRYYENIYLASWVLDTREEFELDFETGAPLPNRRNTNCDIEIHSESKQILNQFYTAHPDSEWGEKRHHGSYTHSQGTYSTDIVCFM